MIAEIQKKDIILPKEDVKVVRLQVKKILLRIIIRLKNFYHKIWIRDS